MSKVNLTIQEALPLTTPMLYTAALHDIQWLLYTSTRQAQSNQEISICTGLKPKVNTIMRKDSDLPLFTPMLYTAALPAHSGCCVLA